MRDRSLPFWSRTGATTTTPIAIALPADWGEIKVWVDVDSYGSIGGAYAVPAVASVNGVTTISSRGSPSSGTFTITAFPNDPIAATTTALNYNDTAANIKTALVATNLFVAGDITAAGGALPADVTLTWTGVYATVVPPLRLNSSVTPGEIVARPTTLAKGNGGYGLLVADQQEIWSRDSTGVGGARFFYVAAVTGAGNYEISTYW